MEVRAAFTTGCRTKLGRQVGLVKREQAQWTDGDEVLATVTPLALV